MLRPLLLLLAVTLPACAGTRSYQTVPVPDPTVELEEPGNARLYIMRANEALWKRADLEVYDGDRLIGNLAPGSHLCWEREPGRVLGRLIFERGGLEGSVEQLYDVHLTAGEVTYALVSFETVGDTIAVEALDAEAGRARIEGSNAAPQR